MKHLQTICVLTAVMLAGRVPAVTLAAAKKASLQLTVDLTDGSRVIGRTTLAELPVRSEALGKIEIPLAKVRAIKFSRDHESVAVTLPNGDSVKGSLGDLSLHLQTAFGNVTVPVEHITTLTVRDGPQAMAGLVLHYSFDQATGDEVIDQNGQNKPATLHRARIIADGKQGSALQLDGEGSFVSFSDDKLPMDNAPRSVAVWLKGSCVALRQVAFVYGAHATGSAVGLGIYERKPGLAVIEWFNLPPASWHSRTSVTDGDWHHAVLVHDGQQTLTLYVDGQPDLTISRTYTTHPGGGSLSLDAAGHGFQGVLDEFMVFNKALSAQEVQALYQSQQ